MFKVKTEVGSFSLILFLITLSGNALAEPEVITKKVEVMPDEEQGQVECPNYQLILGPSLNYWGLSFLEGGFPNYCNPDEAFREPKVVLRGLGLLLGERIIRSFLEEYDKEKVVEHSYYTVRDNIPLPDKCSFVFRTDFNFVSLGFRCRF